MKKGCLIGLILNVLYFPFRRLSLLIKLLINKIALILQKKSIRIYILIDFILSPFLPFHELTSREKL